MINANWSRWIFASVCKHFRDNRGSLTLYIDGEPVKNEPTDLIELRFNGPGFTETSKDVWKAVVEVNILIMATLRRDDMQIIHKYVGTVASAFTDIPVYKYGNGNDDTQAYIDCLRLVRNAQGELVTIRHFGQIGNTNALQASVEGAYEIIFM